MEWLNETSGKKFGLTAPGSRLQLCPLLDQIRAAKMIFVHLTILLSVHCPQLAQHWDKRALGSLRRAECCPVAQPPHLEGSAACPGHTARENGLGGWVWSWLSRAQRLWPKILPVSFITNICGVPTRALQNTGACTAGNNCRVRHLFIYLLLFINWKWICFYTFKILLGGGEELLNSTPCPVQRKEQFFHGWGARSVLNGGSAQPRCQLWQTVPITGWPYFKIREPVLVLKKVRSKQHSCATCAALHSTASTMPLSHGLQQPCHPSPWEGTSTVFPFDFLHRFFYSLPQQSAVRASDHWVMSSSCAVRFSSGFIPIWQRPSTSPRASPGAGAKGAKTRLQLQAGMEVRGSQHCVKAHEGQPGTASARPSQRPQAKARPAKPWN